MRQVQFLLLFLFSFMVSQAQDISGRWSGLIITPTSVFSEEMYFEFDIKQIGERISGTSTIYHYEDYARFEIEGWIHDSIFQFKEIEMLESKIMQGFQWCYASGLLKYSCKNGIAIIKGDYTSELHMSKECNKGTIIVKRDIPCGAVPVISESDLMVIDSSGVIQMIEGREAKKGHTIRIKRPILTIKLFDNQHVDNDIITLLFNGKILLENYTLKKRPKTISFNLDLEAPFNYLTFHAVNLGDLPPNTATIIIDDGVKKHKIQIESDLERSDIIYLNYKP